MISSACHISSDAQRCRAGAHLFLIGGHVVDDAQLDGAAGQPFNAGRAKFRLVPIMSTPALHPFHAAGQVTVDAQALHASGNLFNGRGHVLFDAHAVYAASTFYAVRPIGTRHPPFPRRTAPFHAVCGHRPSDTQIRDAANSTPLRRRAVATMQPDTDTPVATHTQGDNNV